MMTYDYVKHIYPVNPVVGERVRHLVTLNSGTIGRESPSAMHYVMVLFDGRDFTVPCHPTELEYLDQPKDSR